MRSVPNASARARPLDCVADGLLPLPIIEIFSRYHYRLSAELKRVVSRFKIVGAMRIPAY